MVALAVNSPANVLSQTTGPYGFKRTSLYRPNSRTVAHHIYSKNYRKPLLQRYVVRILLMLVLTRVSAQGARAKNSAD